MDGADGLACGGYGSCEVFRGADVAGVIIGYREHLGDAGEVEDGVDVFERVGQAGAGGEVAAHDLNGLIVKAEFSAPERVRTGPVRLNVQLDGCR